MKSGIVIKLENEDRIQKMLDAAQRKARERIAMVADVMRAAERADKHFGIAKSRMKGIEIVCNPNAQRFANAYKYTPEGTVFKIVHTGRDWKIVSADRAFCSERDYTVTRLPEDTGDAILNKYRKF